MSWSTSRILTGKGTLILTWRILDDNGMEIVSQPYTSVSDGVNAIIGGGVLQLNSYTYH